ncbi:MAG: hypothetical protein F4059_06070 [Gemmatimonadetes bacterium]|nr:hypothetical protein [Gemmatimonadota bacterium]
MKIRRHRLSKTVRASTAGGLLLVAASCNPADTADGPGGPEVIELVEAPDICRDCISFETMAVLGGDYDGDNLLTGSVYVTRGPTGRTYVHDFGAGAAEMFFYTSDGELEFTIRREGEGPGEYRDPMPIVELPSGRVAVFDRRNARISILEADGTFIDSGRFPHRVFGPVPVSDSVLLANASIREPAHAGYRYHLVHLNGTILESFGREASPLPEEAEVDFRRMVVIGEDRFLSTSTSGRPYHIELWEGRSLRTTWKRETDWFPGEVPPRQAGMVSPYVTGIYLDGRLLWTLVILQDPEWVPPPPGSRVEQSHAAATSRFNTVVEVIDLTAGEVVASQQFDAAISKLFLDGTAEHLGADELGVPLWEILSLRLREASPE